MKGERWAPLLLHLTPVLKSLLITSGSWIIYHTPYHCVSEQLLQQTAPI